MAGIHEPVYRNFLIFRYKKGGFVSRLLVYFVRQKLQALLWFFFKIQYQPRNVLHGVFNKDPGGRST